MLFYFEMDLAPTLSTSLLNLDPFRVWMHTQQQQGTDVENPAAERSASPSGNPTSLCTRARTFASPPRGRHLVAADYCD